ncbi:hypothetical protein MA16_Dca023174 [Dendrobium catenatum]|uniref:Uncharacterized protein n=1 Tax=Dendrobium catenatum TaxID=906689 RepID=A0A2I0VE65_9ASPA|nr:hypothetical protein MA16_Dca023174 [Dendrobium catenatum]
MQFNTIYWTSTINWLCCCCRIHIAVVDIHTLVLSIRVVTLFARRHFYKLLMTPNRYINDQWFKGKPVGPPSCTGININLQPMFNQVIRVFQYQ